jgi:hypothetical protein
MKSVLVFLLVLVLGPAETEIEYNYTQNNFTKGTRSFTRLQLYTIEFIWGFRD